MALHSVAHRSLASDGYHGRSSGVERSGRLQNIGVSTFSQSRILTEPVAEPVGTVFV